MPAFGSSALTWRFCAVLHPQWGAYSEAPHPALGASSKFRKVGGSTLPVDPSQARGFATWEANHKHIQFRDVGGTGACTTSSGAWNDPCPWQLYVGTDDGKAHPKIAAYVINKRTSAFPVDFPRWWGRRRRARLQACGGRGG